MEITTYTENSNTMVQEMSKKISPFLNSIIEANNYDKLPYSLVIDILELTPEDYVKNINKELSQVYFFGCADLTPKENFERIRQNDTIEDYTYYVSDEDLMGRCEIFYNLSKYLKQECQKYNLPFIDTSYNRNEKIEELVNKIEKI